MTRLTHSLTPAVSSPEHTGAPGAGEQGSSRAAPSFSGLPHQCQHQAYWAHTRNVRPPQAIPPRELLYRNVSRAHEDVRRRTLSCSSTAENSQTQPRLTPHEAGSPEPEAATHTDMKDAQGSSGHAGKRRRPSHGSVCAV